MGLKRTIQLVALLAMIVPVLIFYQSCGQIAYVHPNGADSDTTGSSQSAVRQSLFSTQLPAILAASDGPSAEYELGMAFTAAVAGQIEAIRFYKSHLESGVHVGHIFSSAGQELAQVTFTSETASGWQEQALSVPLPIAANTVYVVSVNTGNTYYVSTTEGLALPIVNGDLMNVIGNNGLLATSKGVFPTTTFQKSNYFRDVVFTAGTFEDKVAPLVALTNPMNNQTVSPGAGVILSAAASDNIKLSKVEIYVDSVLKCSFSVPPFDCPFTASTTGVTYSVQAKAYDAAGNVSVSSTNKLVVATAVKTVPVVTLTSPTNNQTVAAGAQVALTATVSDSTAVSKVEMYVNSGLKCTLTTSPYTCNLATSATGGVSYTVQAKAYDAAGIVSMSSVNTLNVSVLDTTPPAVQLVQPSNNLSVGVGSVAVTATATDNVAVTKVEIYASGVLKCTLTTSPYKCSFMTSTTGNTSYVVQARAYDAKGNVSSSNASTIKVLAPSPTPANGVWVNQSIGPRTGTFVAHFDAVVTSPNANAVVGFSNGPAADFPNLAPIVRFNPMGTLDVRNGTDYGAAVSVAYVTGQPYHFRMVINVATKTYSVYVTPPGQSEITLALNYAFRSDQATVTELNNRADIALSETIAVSGLTVTP